MTTIEKSMIGIMVGAIILFIVSVNYFINVIEDAGGMKNIIIEAGKEAKDISHQIGKDEAL